MPIPTAGDTSRSGARYDEESRWPAILDSLLPDDFQVIEDCANGRTIAFDDPICEYRNGIKQIGTSLYCNNPVDLLIVMLGINDVRYVYITPSRPLSPAPFRALPKRPRTSVLPA